MINKIIVKKISFQELEVIQMELELIARFASYKGIEPDTLNMLIAIDIAKKLYYKLQNKIQNRNDSYRISFSISEAALIVKYYKLQIHNFTDYNETILRKFCHNFDQQLKSLI